MRSKSIVGTSSATKALLNRVALLAKSDVPVLIEGESGTGKELVARALHDRGVRQDRPFLPLNCGALPEGLLESELFGYRRGAFTGAHMQKQGLVEAADTGTLFLDEVGDLSLHAQARLLRVLQEGEVLPLGEVGARRVDVRVLSATHRCLEEEVRVGRFRQDLLYRLRVVALRILPLRERPEDVPPLVRHFLRRYADGHSVSVEPQAMTLLCACPWPGNVRELENEIRRAVTLLGDGEVIGTANLSARIRDYPAGQKSGVSLRERVSKFEAMVIQETLEKYSWNKTRAALALGLSRQSLIRKVARYSLVGPRYPKLPARGP